MFMYMSFYRFLKQEEYRYGMKVVKSLVLGSGITYFFLFSFFFLFLQEVGKTLFRIGKSYILVRVSTIHGRASFKRNEIILLCPWICCYPS